MIALDQIHVRLGSFTLNNVSLQVETGQYAVLMGKTGCGKSTLLEVICGLKPIQAGRIILLERDVSALRPAERGIGYVPQDLALFPSLSVREHLAFALEVRRWSTAQIRERVKELAALLSISHLLDRFPRGLSGGESQRVALGRALAARPPVLLLDEPLSALDDETRNEIIDLLRRVTRQTGVTTLHVTHSRSEARQLADRLFLLEQGIVRDITQRPEES